VSKGVRPSGIRLLGNIQWGTHFCQFYQTREDLVDVLVPYFKAGLENNEYCMWVTSDPLGSDQAVQALQQAVPDLGARSEKGQIDILPHSRWYLKDGTFDSNRVFSGWLHRLDRALAAGFDGLRLTDNTFWLAKDQWRDFKDHEKEVDRLIGQKRMIALCSYCLDRCTPFELIETVGCHQFALIRREGQWEILQSLRRGESERKKMEDALRRSEANLKRAQAVAHVGSWHLDVRINELIWTEETYRIFQHVSGTPLSYDAFLQAVHPDDRERVDQAWSAAMQGAPYDIEHRIQVNGETRWVRERAEVTFDGEGKALEGTGTVQDITDLKRAEDQIRTFNTELESRVRMRTAQLEKALKASHERRAEVSALFKASRAVLEEREFNQTARSIFEACRTLVGADAGYVALLSPDSSEGKALFFETGSSTCTLTPPPSFPIRGLPGEVHRTGRAMIENDFAHSPWAGFLPAGHIAVKNVLFAPLVLQEQVVGLVGIANKPGGFTDQDARMAPVFGELAAVALRNRRLNNCLKEKIEAQKAANEELEAFSYSVSHDLRAPLRHLSGFVQLLKNKEAGELGEQSRHYLEVISEEAGRMGKLIDELLAFSRVGRTQMRHMPLSLDQVAKEAIAGLSPDTAGRNISWRISALPGVYGDPVLLRLVFENLISNAVKFTRTTASAKIEIGHTDGRDEDIIFVRDNGVGFDMKYAGKLFGLFERLHHSDEFEGTGIGLANVQRIIQRHGGKVWAQGTPGRGATFSFSLPRPQ
jgi:signal transduction histidine kinase/PAS domain-containing protein